MICVEREVFRTNVGLGDSFLEARWGGEVSREEIIGKRMEVMEGRINVSIKRKIKPYGGVVCWVGGS